jgi:hypothetical protein
MMVWVFIFMELLAFGLAFIVTGATTGTLPIGWAALLRWAASSQS